MDKLHEKEKSEKGSQKKKKEVSSVKSQSSIHIYIYIYIYMYYCYRKKRENKVFAPFNYVRELQKKRQTKGDQLTKKKGQRGGGAKQ